MKRALIVAGCLLLAACGPNKEERHAAFADRCTAAEFTAKQCELLFGMAEDTRDADNNAAMASGMAAGATAASAGARR